MITCLLTAAMMMASGDTTGINTAVEGQVLRFQLYITPPPESLGAQGCFFYDELLKIEVDNMSKIKSIKLSDSAPDWLRQNLEASLKKFPKMSRGLDSIITVNKVKNTKLLIPMQIKSETYPCPLATPFQPDPLLYTFSNKLLSGNFRFLNTVTFLYSVNYKFKAPE